MSTQKTSTRATPTVYRPGAAFMGWLLPGLGHIVIGQSQRGWRIMFATFMLIVIGVLLGGVDVVDMKQDQLWFIAQAGNGPVAFILDYFNQSLLKTTSAETQARLTSLGHLNAIGTLYIALAGLMNIVVILDVFAGPDRRNDGPARRSSDP